MAAGIDPRVSISSRPPPRRPAASPAGYWRAPERSSARATPRRRSTSTSCRDVRLDGARAQVMADLDARRLRPARAATSPSRRDRVLWAAASLLMPRTTRAAGGVCLVRRLAGPTTTGRHAASNRGQVAAPVLGLYCGATPSSDRHGRGDAHALRRGRSGAGLGDRRIPRRQHASSPYRRTTTPLGGPAGAAATGCAPACMTLAGSLATLAAACCPSRGGRRAGVLSRSSAPGDLSTGVLLATACSNPAELRQQDTPGAFAPLLVGLCSSSAREPSCHRTAPPRGRRHHITTASTGQGQGGGS